MLWCFMVFRRPSLSVASAPSSGLLCYGRTRLPRQAVDRQPLAQIALFAPSDEGRNERRVLQGATANLPHLLSFHIDAQATIY